MFYDKIIKDKANKHFYHHVVASVARCIYTHMQAEEVLKFN